VRLAEARDREQRSVLKLLESSETRLRLEVEELKSRCAALENELKSERARRAAAEEAQAAAEEENEELRPLLDLVELATRGR
jgi:predicted  nucleic acid-binding Zn-ribbon protein